LGAEARLKEFGIELPPMSTPLGNYVKSVRSGNLVFLSGHGPVTHDRDVRSGKVGAQLSLEEARYAARSVGLNLLATLRSELGSLDHVRRIVKVLGMVNCASGFNQTPQVIDGCSNLLIQVFGELIGRHARSAVGMAGLPADIAVEIEMIVEVAD
jgi:enamine deaminase RidA (YjgF/YER057c/UK114 family)